MSQLGCNCHKCRMINSVFCQVYRAWHLCNRETQFSWISKFPPLDLGFHMLYWVHLLLLGYVERPVIKAYICILDGLESTDKQTTTKIWGLFVCVCLSTYVLKEESVHWLFFHIFWLTLSFYQGLKPSLLLAEKASGLFANPSLHCLSLHEEKFEPLSEACFLWPPDL